MVQSAGSNNDPTGPFQFVSGFENLQLDIVGFLAILGEGSVLANAQVASLSKWIFAPRLLPAPQALLRPTRPLRLETSPGNVTGVFSGNDKDHVNHIGNVVIDAESMPKFAVRCVKVVRVPHNPEVKAKTKAPLTAVAVLGCMMSMLLLALAIYWQDLPALLANLCLSFLSTLIGLGNKWRLELPKRAKKSHHVPPGDVVIRYPKGSFLIVQCDEDVARELYFAPETINYLVSRPPIYRLISLVGTMMLMFGVISLANADNKLQVAFAGCYMALNAAYWVVAAVPAKLHWDTSLFRVENQRFDKHYHAEDDRLVPVQRCKNEIVQHDTFTEALWKVLVVTRSIEWVRRNEAAPETSVWDQWLRDALEKTQGIPEPYTIDKQGMTVWTVPKWDPQGHFGMLQKAENEKNATIRAEVQHRARVSYESQRLVEMEPLQV